MTSNRQFFAVFAGAVLVSIAAFLVEHVASASVWAATAVPVAAAIAGIAVVVGVYKIQFSRWAGIVCVVALGLFATLRYRSITSGTGEPSAGSSEKGYEFISLEDRHQALQRIALEIGERASRLVSVWGICHDCGSHENVVGALRESGAAQIRWLVSPEANAQNGALVRFLRERLDACRVLAKHNQLEPSAFFLDDQSSVYGSSARNGYLFDTRRFERLWKAGSPCK